MDYLFFLFPVRLRLRLSKLQGLVDYHTKQLISMKMIRQDLATPTGSENKQAPRSY